MIVYLRIIGLIGAILSEVYMIADLLLGNGFRL